MSAALGELAPAPSAETAEGRAPRSRTTFPVGARFPRRTAADVLGYLAELELRGEPVRSTGQVRPIGARFPLR